MSEATAKDRSTPMTAQPIDDNTPKLNPDLETPDEKPERNHIPAELAAKIAKASLSIDSVPKRGRNDFHSYDYATADDVMEVAREALGRVKVAVFPSIADEEWGTRQTNSGTRKCLRLTMRYQVVDGESGAQWTTEWRADSEDDADKAFYKAYTQSRKYFLRELLNISTGEPLDVEFHNDPGGPSARQGGGQRQKSRDEIPGINDPGQSGGGSEFRGRAEQAAQQSPPTQTNDQKIHDKLTGRIGELLEEVDIEDDAHPALASYVAEKYGVDSWSEVSTDQLKEIGTAIGSQSASGGRRSLRRRFLDARMADYRDEPLADAVDWRATGRDDDADWQALNGRWRSLLAEAVSGDQKRRQYHEAIKARHEVDSFNDLTSGEIVQDIAKLEQLEPTDPDDHMPPRTEYIFAQIDEYVPQSGELDFGGEGSDDVTLDGVGLDGAPARFVRLLREADYRDEWISAKLTELSPEGDPARADNRHVEPLLPAEDPDQEQWSEWVDALPEWLKERRQYRKERDWPVSPRPDEERVRPPKKEGQLERDPEARRGRGTRPGDTRRDMRKDRQGDPDGIDLNALPEPHRELVALLDDIDPEHGRKYIDRVVIPQSNCSGLADMPDGAAERWAETVRGHDQEWLHTKIS